MKRLGLTLGSLLLAGIGSTALAQTYPPGPYIGLGGGVTNLNDAEIKSTTPFSMNDRDRTDLSYNVLGFGG
jgi:hypothetical protein